MRYLAVGLACLLLLTACSDTDTDRIDAALAEKVVPSPEHADILQMCDVLEEARWDYGEVDRRRIGSRLTLMINVVENARRDNAATQNTKEAWDQYDAGLDFRAYCAGKWSG